MSEYIGNIDKKQVHIIKIDFDWYVYEDAFEENKKFIINKVNHAYLIRSGCCENKNDIPKCSNVVVNETILPYNHKKGFRWQHVKEIDNNSNIIIDVENQAMENYNFESELNKEEEVIFIYQV